MAAGADRPLPTGNIPHQKNTSILASDFLHDHLAEVAHPIQFNCVAFHVNQRDTDGTITVARLSNYISGNLRKRINAAAVPHWSSFIRLLLFPNHYFW